MDEITQMCEWILSKLGPLVPMHFSAFHPDYKMTNIQSTTPSSLIKIRQRALDIGIKYVYIGNVINEEASSTYCHNCNSLLIRRSWYRNEIINLKEGSCHNCSENIPGIFN